MTSIMARVRGSMTEPTVVSAAEGRARPRGLSVAAICIATVVVVALPWIIFAGKPGGLGFAAADPTATVANSPSDQVEPSTDPSAAVLPTATPQALPALPGMPPSRVTAELSRALRAAAVRLMPQATFGPTVVGFDGGDRLLEPFDVVDNGHGYYVGWAAIRNGSLEGQFVIAIWPHADDKKSPSPGCDSAYFPRLGCETRTGPNGEQITIDKGKLENSETVEYRVKVHRPDGLILMAAVTSSPMPPMTSDGLVELLLTPGLELNLNG
jgi:hypothetical protein